MNFDLDKKDLISLVKGTHPHYDVFEHKLVKRCGNYTGGMSDRWSWNYNISDLTEVELFDLYTTCKNSW